MKPLSQNLFRFVLIFTVGTILSLALARYTYSDTPRANSHKRLSQLQKPSVENSADLFTGKILPIFGQACFACHGETVQRSGLDLRTKETALKGGAHGPAIRPGNAKESLLYRLITHQDEPHMPMGGAKLADPELEVIAGWIDSLPAAEAQPVSGGEALIRAAGSGITAKDREFWSFRTPIRPEIKSVKDSRWVRNAIDAFVLRHLEDKKLKPAPAAEPHILLRRAYFDLIGLPPSPQEIDAFLADPSDRAYETVIDRLLASPHYGERWGRHWLDLARYADSGGFEFDVDRPHAWRYRDYVIRSFNEDKPYDRFIKEQLAGDELDAVNPEALIATGFCRNGPTVDNASNEQTRMDELDDMVSTTSSVFMGLTVGCARCHDHKYDPIQQKDYYGMQAIFFPSQKTERLLADAAEQESFKVRNKEIDELIKPYREKIAALEKFSREKLLAEKVDRFVSLAAQTGALEGKNPEDYRKSLAEQFAKDVKLQPDEIEALLSPEEATARKELMAEIEKLNRSRPKPLPTAMGVTDKESEPPKSYLLKRGDFRQKGEEVQPGFLLVLAGESNLVAPAPPGTKSTLRRKQLADWIASPQHPLTARVAVNRIWQYHFGRGIVKTASDFGLYGDRPSHPELLDWLATEFVARGWSLKAMHRLIMVSNTYRQSARFDADSFRLDPENRLLWRMSPRRLQAEVIRDAILATSGQLNRKMGGPGIFPRIDPAVIGTGSTNKWPVDVREGPEVWRRSVYVYVKRSVILPLIEVFDCPDTTVSSPVRSASTIAPQALALLNNEFVLEQARFLARRVLQEAGKDSRNQILHAYKLALGRKPGSKELSWALDFLDLQARSHEGRLESAAGAGNGSSPAQPHSSNAAELAALGDFCHVLFNLSEFLYTD